MLQDLHGQDSAVLSYLFFPLFFERQSFIPLFHRGPGCLGIKVQCVLAAMAWHSLVMV